MDFVAIDFETANSFRGSPCEVALVKVQDGKVVESLSSLLFQENFAAFNIDLHGITSDMVRKAPTIQEFWPKLSEFIGDLPLVAHYAAFDTGVLRDSLGLDAFKSPLKYFCTVVLARQALSLPSHGLPWVASHLGIEFEETHRGLPDAIAAASIAIKLMELKGANTLQELADSLEVKPGTISAEGWAGSFHRNSHSGSLTAKQRAEILQNIPESELYEDPDFLGCEVVFTGALGSMTRTEAQLLVMRAGGIPKNSVTKGTSMLVFGQQESYALRPGALVSSKMEKALKLIAEGSNLEMIDEKTFLEMISSPEGIEAAGN
jgi:DNA polymerase III epsilon subunit-like protein